MTRMLRIPPETRLSEIRQRVSSGQQLILVTESDGRAVGDLFLPAQYCTDQHVNYMARLGRGLVRLALTGQRVDELGLPLQPYRNSSRDLGYTVSIEAREGISTGISAADRAKTIAVAIDPATGSEGLCTPGHVFPIRANAGGLLQKRGPAEAAIEICRLAGAYPAGVLCQIMNRDGDLADHDDLRRLSAGEGLTIVTLSEVLALMQCQELEATA